MSEAAQGADSLKHYILGELTETEIELVEAQYFAEAESLLELQALCFDLLDAWFAHELLPTESAALATRFHALPALREKAAFLQSLQQVLTLS